MIDTNLAWATRSSARCCTVWPESRLTAFAPLARGELEDILSYGNAAASPHHHAQGFHSRCRRRRRLRNAAEPFRCFRNKRCLIKKRLPYRQKRYGGLFACLSQKFQICFGAPEGTPASLTTKRYAVRHMDRLFRPFPGKACGLPPARGPARGALFAKNVPPARFLHAQIGGSESFLDKKQEVLC